MGKADVWASFGSGLVMTAAGLVFNVWWLLILAAACYAIALALYLRQRRKGVAMGDDKKPDVIGLDIDNDGGTGAEINVGGTGQPTIGSHVHLVAQPGQNTIGTRIVQRGPGVGMVVNVNGPGIGHMVTIADKPENKDKKP